MWRLTIIQKEMKKSVVNDEMYETTNEITLEADCKKDILGIIDVMGELRADNVSYKIEKVVEE